MEIGDSKLRSEECGRGRGSFISDYLRGLAEGIVPRSGEIIIRVTKWTYINYESEWQCTLPRLPIFT